MGTTTAEFVNIQNPDPASRLTRATGDARDNAGPNIQAAVTYLMARSPPGGVIYFPPGTYSVSPAPSTAVLPGVYGGTVAIPDPIALEFAPGAMLHAATVGGQTAIIEIEGGIIAGLYKIFDAPPTRDAPGTILLTGTRVAEVYPEWWGAYPNASIDSTAAVQSCIDGAYRDRILRNVRNNGISSFPPIPVVLTGQFLLTSTVVVTGNTSGFQLRGAQGSGTQNQGTPSLYGSLAAPSTLRPPAWPWAMLYIEGGTGWTIDNVQFMAQQGTFTCLWAELDSATATMSPGPRLGGASQVCTLRGCSFTRDPTSTQLRELVRIGGANADPLATSGPANPANIDRPRNLVSGNDMSGLLFDACYFDMGGAADGASANGVVLNASEAVGIRLHGCFFNGLAKSFISCMGGAFSVDATSFQNVNPTGYDIFLESPGTVGHADVPGSFTATLCESQSWSFLGTFQGTYPSAAGRNTVLTGIRHANVNTKDHHADPPSIQWDSAGAASALVLVGCYLHGDVQIGPFASAVVDLGTVFASYRPSVGGDVRGGKFTGNLAVLRGVPGLIASPDVPANWALNAPGMRAGANLQFLLPAMPAESTDPGLLNYPWSAGDVVVNRATAAATATVSPPGTGLALDAVLHNVYRARSLVVPADVFGTRAVRRVATGATTQRVAWERVFGSEDYAGPYIDSYLDNELTLDTLIVPSAYAIYEVLWDVCPQATISGASSLRAVGRDTVVVSTSGLNRVPADTEISVRLSLTPTTVAGRTYRPDSMDGLPTAVASTVSFVEYTDGLTRPARIESASVTLGALANQRLSLHFTGLLQSPWSRDTTVPWYDVRIRRLKWPRGRRPANRPGQPRSSSNVAAGTSNTRTPSRQFGRVREPERGVGLDTPGGRIVCSRPPWRKVYHDPSASPRRTGA